VSRSFSGKISAALLWSIRVENKIVAFLVAAVAFLSPMQCWRTMAPRATTRRSSLRSKESLRISHFGNPHANFIDVKKDDGSVENGGRAEQSEYSGPAGWLEQKYF